MLKLYNAVNDFIKNNGLAGAKILAGLSGGIDSAVLTDILSKIEGIKLIAIHLNHNWRGIESKRDKDFAMLFAKKRGIEFYFETLSLPKKTETAARCARYDFFDRCRIKFNADAVFLAHNKNDNAETLIYRLFKGTGPMGMNSIPLKRDFYYRPLLNFSREDIEKYAKENNVAFINDSSNFDLKYKRNYIREKILPSALEINKDALNAVSRFIELNKMNQKIVENAVLNARTAVFESNKILRDKFLNLSSELEFELINRYLKGHLKTRDFKTITKIIKFIKNNARGQISINKETFLKVYNNKIYLRKNSVEKIESEILLKPGLNKFGKTAILLEEAPIPDDFLPNTYILLDFKNKYTIRTRKNGDIIQTFGTKKPQKLKTFFIKKKIPSEIRSKIPLITLGNEILFIPDIMTSEKLRVDKKCKKCYKITIEGDLWN